MGKIKDLLKWVIDSASIYFTEKPWFDSSKYSFELTQRVNKMIAHVRCKSIVDMDDESRRNFVRSFIDLVEMAPYVAKVDKVLGGSINTAIALATPLFKQCKFEVDSNVERMEPVWVYLFGPPGKGKSYLSRHVS